MSEKYKVRNQDKLYYVTFSVVYWIDVFSREEYVSVLIDSLKYCQKEKGLEIYAWVIMSNHVHLIVGREKEENPIQDIIRDFKKYTSDNAWEYRYSSARDYQNSMKGLIEIKFI